MNTNALFNIGYGLYVLTTSHNGIDNGCIVNTVMQVTSSPLQVAVTVNKGNYTHDLIQASGVFNVSMLTIETPMFVYEHFGFQSGRTLNKFATCKAEHRAVNQVLYIPNTPTPIWPVGSAKASISARIPCLSPKCLMHRCFPTNHP